MRNVIKIIIKHCSAEIRFNIIINKKVLTQSNLLILFFYIIGFSLFLLTCI